MIKNTLLNKNKKATELTFQTVVILIIGIIVLVVIVMFFTGNFGDNSKEVFNIGNSSIKMALNYS